MRDKDEFQKTAKSMIVRSGALRCFAARCDVITALGLCAGSWLLARRDAGHVPYAGGYSAPRQCVGKPCWLAYTGVPIACSCPANCSTLLTALAHDATAAGDEASTISTDSERSLTIAAKLMSVDKDALAKVMMTRRIDAGGTVVFKELPPKQVRTPSHSPHAVAAARH